MTSSAVALMHLDPFRALAESSFNAVLITCDDRLCFANQRAAEMLGYPTPDALLGVDPVTLIAPASREMAARMIRENRPGIYRALVQRRDGSTFWAEAHGTACTYEGRPARVTALRDINDRIRSQDDLSRRETYFRALIEHVHDLVMVVDEGGYVRFLSPSSERILGYAADQLEDRFVLRLLHAEDREPARAFIERVLQEPTRRHTFRVRAQHASGAWRLLEITCSRFHADDLPPQYIIGARDLTDQRETEEQLRQSEAMLARAQAVAHVGSWEWNLPANTLRFSDEMYRIFGIEPGTALHFEDAFVRVHPDDQVATKAALDASIASGEPFHYDQRIIWPDGSVRILHIEGGYGNAERTLFVGTGWDVTAQRAAEERLRQSERRFRAIFDSMFQFTGLLTPEGILLEANQTALDFGGIQAQDAINRPVWEAHWFTGLPETQIAVRTAVTQAAHGAFVRFPLDIRGADGRRATIDFSIKPVVDEHGQVVLLIPEGRDITEQRATEQRLRQSEALLRSVVSQLPVALIVTDAAGCITVADGEGIERFWSDPSRWLGHPVERGLADYPVLLDALQAAHHGTASRRLVILDDATLEWFASPLLDADGTVRGVQGLAVDVTDLKRSEEAVRASMERLRQLSAHMESVREEERTRIAREVHDVLGQALTALRMDLLWSRARLTDDPAAVDDRLQQALGSVDETIKTVRRIASDLRPSILDHFGLAAALEWQLQEFSRRTGLAGTFEDTSDGLADALPRDASTALFRVFQEALTNVARHAEAQQVVGSLSQSPDGRLCLRVADDGRGIRPESLAQTQSLGLLGMRERVLQWGGEVEVRGQPGAGTTIIVHLNAA